MYVFGHDHSRIFAASVNHFFGVMFMGLPITMYMISREQSLCVQNDADKVLSYLGQFLNEGEKPLVVVSGRAYGVHAPEWLPNDFYVSSYFVFTSDRLIVIALSAQEIGMKKSVTSTNLGPLALLYPPSIPATSGTKEALKSAVFSAVYWLSLTPKYKYAL